MSDTIALMWDCNGLEAAEVMMEMDQQKAWALLQGKPTNWIKPAPNLMHWRLRAQANSQRHYEIYLVSVDQGVTVDLIREAFESNPQGMADTVRRIGHKFYSDRAPDEVRIR